MNAFKLRCISAFLLMMTFAPVYVFAADPVFDKTTESDFQFRGGWTVEKGLSRKVKIEWSEEFRIKDSFGSFDRLYSEIGGEYKVTDWLKVRAKYTHILIDKPGKPQNENRNPNSYWENRHRGSLGLTFTYKTYCNWRFSLREMVQVTSLDDEVHGYRVYDDGEKSNPKWVLRSRLKAEYAFRHIPLTPYVSVELVNTLNSPNVVESTGSLNENSEPIYKKYAGNEYVESVRTAIGCQYRFDRRNSIDVYFRFDHDFDKDINYGSNSGRFNGITEETSNIFIVGVNYKFRF